MGLQRGRRSIALDSECESWAPQLVQNPVTLAVVEDDAEYRDSFLVPRLAAAGFEAHGMASALELYRAMTMRRYDLVLLDAVLPDEDGYRIAAHLRGLSSSTGIVMLTGLGSAPDRVRGLRAGVDAYLHKPTDIETVIATLRNLKRRVEASLAQTPVAQTSRWRLEETGWRLVAPDGTVIEMSPAERQVLSVLAAQPGVPVPRETLIERLVKDVDGFDPHRLEMLLYRLRNKCSKLTGEKLPLKAVRGTGYVLVW